MSDIAWAAIVGGFGVILSIITAAITATWILGRAAGAAPTDKDLKDLDKKISDLDKRTDDKLARGIRDCGEGIAAIRSHVGQIELWTRDHLVRIPDFAEVENDVKDIVRRLIEFAAITVKVDTMWSFQMRRAMSEAVDRKLGTMESPLTFTPEAIAALDPLKDELIEFYKSVPASMSDGEVLIEIEQKFGDRLLELVCIPLHLTNGACLLLAYSVAKQATSLELVLQ